MCTIVFSAVVLAQKKEGAHVPPPPPPIVAEEIPPPVTKDVSEVFLQHPTIKSIYWSDSGRKLHVEYKNGKKEIYLLGAEGAENKAPGFLPPPPPPPPAVPSRN